jgi:molybdopterin molybdotransferase
MLTVEQALELVLARAPRLPAERVDLAAAAGRVLAEPVAADRDMPPWDKSAMDGFAVRAVDCPAGPVRLEVIGEIAAGRTAAVPLRPGTAMRIMTGAPLPTGADAVVMVEKTRTDGAFVLLDGPVKSGQSVSPRASDIAAGATVLPAGAVITAAGIGALAAVGAVSPAVYRVPSVAVLATGDEIVEIDRVPAGAQIRNSNSWALAAQVRAVGCPVTVLPPARDEPEHLAASIGRGLEHDVLILSGGVSMGEYDLVPAALTRAAVTIHAHKVAMKPGKPFLLGTAGAGTLVFGLPGNPVSTFVCFELFVAPALRRMAGHAEPVRPPVPAVSVGALPAGTDRKTYLPARLTRRAGQGPAYSVERLEWHGSADIFGPARADGLLIREIAAPAAGPGTIVEVMRLKTE